MFMFSIFDKGLGEFGPPFVAPNLAIAQRMTYETMGRVPEIAKPDLTLYRLSQWDPKTGRFNQLDDPEEVDMFAAAVPRKCDLVDLIKKEG